jgi:hypothetical protein
VNSNNLLALNVSKLKEIKGMNNAQMSRKALEGGFKLHSSTVKNIVEMGHDFRSEKLDALGYVFDIEPAFLLWSAGFDNDGKPIGVGNNVPLSAVKWAVKKITLALSHMEIDDLDFQATATAAVIKVAADKDFDAADIEWQKQLANYQPRP